MREGSKKGKNKYRRFYKTWKKVKVEMAKIIYVYNKLNKTIDQNALQLDVSTN